MLTTRPLVLTVGWYFSQFSHQACVLCSRQMLFFRISAKSYSFTVFSEESTSKRHKNGLNRKRVGRRRPPDDTWQHFRFDSTLVLVKTINYGQNYNHNYFWFTMTVIINQSLCNLTQLHNDSGNTGHLNDIMNNKCETFLYTLLLIVP